LPVLSREKLSMRPDPLRATCLGVAACVAVAIFAFSDQSPPANAGGTKGLAGGAQRAGAMPVIGGYDVVEYFSLAPNDTGVKGVPEYAHHLTSPDADGTARFTYEFWFSSLANKNKFAADPWKYAPKYGGW